jgi:hypothetical protein
VTAYVKLTGSRFAVVHGRALQRARLSRRLCASPRAGRATSISPSSCPTRNSPAATATKAWDEFDGHGPNQAWIDDLAKRNGELAADFKLNGDFKVYAASHCIQFRDKPRVLLAAPTNLEHIARSTAWWDDPAPTNAEGAEA